MTTRPPPPRAEDVFYDLLGIEPAGRSAALDAACAGNETLKAEVRSLLANHRDESDFLETGGVRALAGVEEIAPLSPGARIAGYTVLGVLGAGGMGVVYTAEQDRPRRTVALKVVRRSAAGLLRRFEHEAELLGRLQHPGIAQIYEAGVADLEGRGPTPFIAMELVQGRALTEYTRNTPLGARLELFARVCDGVQHAHQRGIIHRDLKPANILVDAHGQPKVLDFGVARAVEAGLSIATAGTHAGQIVGTLQYMSPEQARADPEDVDTRSDVYALGVILFQVLTGRLPHDLSGRTLPEASRLICDVPAPRVGTIDRSLRGDVEIIVAKALEKEKDRRYRSAADLAEDLRSHLQGLPIAARHDSAFYVLRKGVRRYKGAVTVGVASIAALAGFAIYASVQSSKNQRLARSESKATAEALAALKAAKDARELADKTAVKVQSELNISTVERGRLLGHAGNLAAAEALLWPAHLRDPTSRQSHWALWELYAHEPCMATVASHEGIVAGLALSPDGGTLYSSGADGLVKEWDTRTARPMAQFQGSVGPACDMSLSADGRSLAVASTDGYVAVWDVATRRQRLKIAAHTGAALSAAFNPDGTKLVTGGVDDLVRLWDVSTGQHLGDMPEPPANGILRVAWSPDGAWIACAVGPVDCRILLWDGAGPPISMAGHPWGSISLAFSPDSRTLASGGFDREIRLWDVPTHEAIGELHSPNGSVRALTFSADGRSLISSGWWSIEVWNVELRRKQRAFSLIDSAYSTCISADNTLMATGFGNGTVQFWDVATNPGQIRLGGQSGRITGALSPDGRLAATGDAQGVLRFWDSRDGRLLAAIPAHAARIKTIKFSPDGRLLATSAEDGLAKLWDLRTGAALGSTDRHAGLSCDSVCFSPDGRLLAVTKQDTAVVLLRVPDMSVVRRLPTDGKAAVSVRFTPDGRTLGVVTRERSIFLWPVEAGDPRILPCPTNISPWSIAFSPDGSRMAIGDWAKDVEFWDVASGAVLDRFHGHSGLVTAVEYMPGQKDVLASAAADGAVRLWDTSTGLTLATLEAFDGWDAISLSFAPDGRRLLACGARGEGVIWDLTYFDRHIAGNAEHQISTLSADLGAHMKADAVRAWADNVRAALRSGPPTAPPVGVGPDEVLAWPAR